MSLGDMGPDGEHFIKIPGTLGPDGQPRKVRKDV
jgi:hypothetical protein